MGISWSASCVRVRYSWMGDSSHNFAGRLAADWAAQWYLTSDLRGIPSEVHSESTLSVLRNPMAPPIGIFICTFIGIVIVTFIVIIIQSFGRTAHDEEQTRWRGRAFPARGLGLPGSLISSRRFARVLEDALLAVFLARRRLVFRGRVL